MLNNLLKKLQRLSAANIQFDPSRFNDPVAEQTAWNPAKGGGTNFRTHKLINVNPYRIEFRATIGAKIFYLIFLFLGLGLIIAFAISTFTSKELSINPEMLIPIGIGLVFAVVGGSMLYFGTAPIVFDKRLNCFWKGRKTPGNMLNRSSMKNFLEFQNIHSLQIIPEYCRGNKSSFYSYELNIVMKDGNRINVIDHGNLKKLRKDAASISAFLERPVWDAILL